MLKSLGHCCNTLAIHTELQFSYVSQFLCKAIGAAIKFTGNISFTNNHAESSDGGALYMLTSSQIMLNNGSHLEFANNTGGYGTAIHAGIVLLC